MTRRGSVPAPSKSHAPCGLKLQSQDCTLADKILGTRFVCHVSPDTNGTIAHGSLRGSEKLNEHDLVPLLVVQEFIYKALGN